MPDAPRRRSTDRGQLGRVEGWVENASPILRLLTPGGVVALVPIALAILSGIHDNREATCAVGAKVSAVVRVDNELSKPRNAELRRLLLVPPAVCSTVEPSRPK